MDEAIKELYKVGPIVIVLIIGLWWITSYFKGVVSEKDTQIKAQSAEAKEMTNKYIEIHEKTLLSNERITVTNERVCELLESVSRHFQSMRS